MRLSELLASGKSYDLASIQLDRYGYRGDIADAPAVVAWLRSHPLIDFDVPTQSAAVALRPEQAAFRNEVGAMWNWTCPLSGCTVREVLDAAHLGGPGGWRVPRHLQSGVLLRCDLHRLLDAGLLTIDERGAASCAAPGYEWVNGRIIAIP
jgi:hypothetical protein